MSTFAKKLHAEQSACRLHHRRNPKTPDGLKKWLRRNALPVVGKLVAINADLRRMYGDEARVELRAFPYGDPGTERWGGYRPSGAYFDLSVTLTGGIYGVGRSLYLEVADNRLHSPRFGWTFDADDPNSPESRDFLDKIETEIARQLRGERPAKMVH